MQYSLNILHTPPGIHRVILHTMIYIITHMFVCLWSNIFSPPCLIVSGIEIIFSSIPFTHNCCHGIGFEGIISRAFWGNAMHILVNIWDARCESNKQAIGMYIRIFKSSLSDLQELRNKVILLAPGADVRAMKRVIRSRKFGPAWHYQPINDTECLWILSIVPNRKMGRPNIQ